MIENRFSVGIDISADDFYVSLMCFDGQRSVVKGSKKFSNNYSGFVAFLKWLANKIKGGKALFVMEATGVYYEELAYFLHCEGKDVAVVLANKIKHYANSLNVKTKTDKVDAGTIALFGLERRPDLWEPMSPLLRDIRYLCRERLSLKNDLTRVKNQLHALKRSHNAYEGVMDLKQQHIDFMEGAIEEIEKQISVLIDSDKKLKKGVAKLETIVSIRKFTIITILCETNGFWGFNSIRQVVSYAGLDVKHHQSGKYAGRSKISKQGNVRIRQCLYMPALNATQHNEPMKQLYERVIEKNPTLKRKGIVACMRKMLGLVFVLWKKDEEFDPNYQWKSKDKESDNKDKKRSNKDITSGNDEKSSPLVLQLAELKKKEVGITPTSQDKHRFKESKLSSCL
jgi:transposase